ncbi:D-alanyl-D-alanine carboxypeptidase [Methylocystis sp. WRRC1]|uniref:D-alanyl-D-alanine carboxypeptidase family protein n=1 Tax=Methylocystis sp. WRRC1 TaxID=1732014 RepID=UPI001D1348B6|nr:D-alanyl-D-alanine carboxypeptidase family protein [Methylocystis sp. WRRC1]MCC3244055.1 D-alanyl-D-alanine carboxypeptidase [Methylocystis sp. WRRC1]
MLSFRYLIAAVFVAVSSLFSGSALAQAFQTSVPNAILIDAGTNTVLFEKGADDLVTPASTVKILTAEMIFRELTEGRLKLGDVFTVSEYAWRNGGAPAGGSAMFLKVNSQATVEDLLRGLLIDSGNDAALVLAEGVAGSEEAFVMRMNKRASELGLVKSRFGNPWGKASDDQKVTPREMAKLALHVIRTYPDFYKYFGEKEFTWNNIRQQNRNPLLTMSIGADGLKTGNIEKGDFGIVGSANQEGRRLIVAVYGAKTAKERAEEARKLLQWGFRNFEEKDLFKVGEPIGPAQIYGGVQGSVDLVSKTDVKVLLPRGGTEKLTGKIVYEGPVIAPVEAGAGIGRLEVKRGNAVVLEQPLEAAESVAEGSLSSRAFDAVYEYAAAKIHEKLNKKK